MNFLQMDLVEHVQVVGMVQVVACITGINVGTGTSTPSTVGHHAMATAQHLAVVQTGVIVKGFCLVETVKGTDIVFKKTEMRRMRRINKAHHRTSFCRGTGAGYGDGSGTGNCTGSGDGSGSGSGYGDGTGNGACSGSGSGDGDGFGSGYGCSDY